MLLQNSEKKNANEKSLSDLSHKSKWEREKSNIKFERALNQINVQLIMRYYSLQIACQNCD